MGRKLVAGAGWKMNHTAAEARRYIQTLLPLLAGVDDARVEVFVLPPFTSLAAVEPLLNGTPVGLGAQNMHGEPSGAWTGEVAPPMLLEAGCRYVELGHSERRYHFNETDETVNRKVLAALAHGLVPILCIGETQEERAAGQTEAVLAHQVQTALRGVEEGQRPAVILAYEPRWAIGQQDAASPAYIQAAHCFLRAGLAAWYGPSVAEQTRIIYGGSVNLDNAGSIIALPDVDGLFIGRAALDPQAFARLVRLVEQAARAREDAA